MLGKIFDALRLLVALAPGVARAIAAIRDALKKKPPSAEPKK